jgi:hypothetical protein
MKILEILSEAWSQKYKSSINCSHPRGFSQKAHCAGKKKRNESIEMEMTCPDCGMCETHGDNLVEVKQRLDAKCWKGKHKEGTKIKGGIRVNNCVPNESLDADQKRAGQVGGKERAKKIGTVLGTDPKQHPFKGRLVGEGEEGSPEGVEHLTKELLQHIVQQVGTEGAHAVVKSLTWGDGAAKELLHLIVKDLEQNIKQGVAEGYGRYYCSTDKRWKERKGPKQTRKS